MIVSFHPCFEADINIICAGRDPDADDLNAIQGAAAVVLPQGCRESLYRMAKANCAHVFPDYAARFRYPGKTGQARLFAETGFPHPKTRAYADTSRFRQSDGSPSNPGLPFPFVFKMDWGGEGDTVSLIRNADDWEQALSRVAAFERSGQYGFVLQEFIPATDRTLRVVVVGQYLHAYWRIQDNPMAFGTSVSHGARIDSDADPKLRQAGIDLTRNFCEQTGINLAGLDLIFKPAIDSSVMPWPLFLEINYFFGRTGIGGSEAFYDILEREIDRWLKGLDQAIVKPDGVRL